MNYWLKKRGIDKEASIILAVKPKYVINDFKKVQKLHGTKHAVRWLKGAHRIRKR
jgi:hypothetical protein